MAMRVCGRCGGRDFSERGLPPGLCDCRRCGITHIIWGESAPVLKERPNSATNATPSTQSNVLRDSE